MTTKSTRNKPSGSAPSQYHPRHDASARQMVLRAAPSIRVREVSAFVPDERSNLLSADPRLFRDQVQRGASHSIVDWLAYWSHVMSPSGELVDLEKRFKTALAYQRAHPEIAQDLEPARNKPNVYFLRISSTSKIYLRVSNDRLLVSANPVMAFQSFNEFCTIEPYELIKRFTCLVMRVLRRVLRLPGALFYRSQLTRIDITQMIRCPSVPVAVASFANMRLHLRWLSRRRIMRDDAVYGNCIVISPNSKRETLKYYLPSWKRGAVINKDEDTWIRAEYTLRTRQLKDLIRDGTWLPNDLSGVLLSAMARQREAFRQYRPSRHVHPPKDLPNHLWMVWYLWVSGANIRLFPQIGRRFNRLCREMLEYGIDIKCQPTPSSMAMGAKALKLEEIMDPARWDADCHTNPELLDRLLSM